MDADEVVLYEGRDGDDQGDGWLPEVSLTHDGSRRELYVNVGEEMGGMCEGVDDEVFQIIRSRLVTAAKLLIADEVLRECGVGPRWVRRLNFWLRERPWLAAAAVGWAVGVYTSDVLGAVT